jgi:hypothetical protein
MGGKLELAVDRFSAEKLLPKVLSGLRGGNAMNHH